MFDNDFDADRPPSLRALQLCLQQLVDEADELNLVLTRAALERALKICIDEGSEDMPIGPTPRPNFIRIH